MEKRNFIFTPQEKKELLKSSNFHGFLSVATTWGMIAGSFSLVAFFPNFLTYGVAFILLGGRHLALAILMHEAAHGALFPNKGVNDWVGKWLCSYPTWQDLIRYREHHMRHHQFTGSDKDPDLSLVSPFPISKKSFFRKMLRDLSGVTGLKRIYGLLLMDFGFIEYTASGGAKIIPAEKRPKGIISFLGLGFKNLRGVILTNLILWGTLHLLGVSSLYYLWVLSYLIPFSVFVRIRSIAEHACTQDSLNPFFNTRSTFANFFARVTVAPHYVNYHLEHHLLMKAPCFRLPQIHKMLKERGLMDKAITADGYGEVLKLAIS